MHSDRFIKLAYYDIDDKEVYFADQVEIDWEKASIFREYDNDSRIGWTISDSFSSSDEFPPEKLMALQELVEDGVAGLKWYSFIDSDARERLMCSLELPIHTVLVKGIKVVASERNS